jgi:hypothetical protein
MRKLNRSRTIALALAGAFLLALGGAMATSADTGLTHRGNFGAHYLADTEEYPGARCLYNNATVIRAIKVQDPLVFAENRVRGRVDSQKVSWFFKVQAQPPGGKVWTTVARSDLEKKTATDAQVANFSPMTKAFAGSAAQQYRVVVVIRWYGADQTTVRGRTSHLVDWYSWEGVPSFENLCPGGLF